MTEFVITIVAVVLIAVIGLLGTSKSVRLGGLLGDLLGEKDDKEPEKIDVATDFKVTDVEAKERPSSRVTDEDLDYLE